MCSSRSGGEQGGDLAGSRAGSRAPAQPVGHTLGIPQPTQGRAHSQPHAPSPWNPCWELRSCLTPSPLCSSQPGAGQSRGCHGFHRAHDPAHLPHAASRGRADPLHNGLSLLHVRAWAAPGPALCLLGEAPGALLQGQLDCSPAEGACPWPGDTDVQTRAERGPRRPAVPYLLIRAGLGAPEPRGLGVAGPAGTPLSLQGHPCPSRDTLPLQGPPALLSPAPRARQRRQLRADKCQCPLCPPAAPGAVTGDLCVTLCQW